MYWRFQVCSKRSLTQLHLKIINFRVKFTLKKYQEENKYYHCWISSSFYKLNCFQSCYGQKKGQGVVKLFHEKKITYDKKTRMTFAFCSLNDGQNICRIDAHIQEECAHIYILYRGRKNPPKPDRQTYRRTDISVYRVASLLKTSKANSYVTHCIIVETAFRGYQSEKFKIKTFGPSGLTKLVLIV